MPHKLGFVLKSILTWFIKRQSFPHSLVVRFLFFQRQRCLTFGQSFVAYAISHHDFFTCEKIYHPFYYTLENLSNGEFRKEGGQLYSYHAGGGTVWFSFVEDPPTGSKTSFPHPSMEDIYIQVSAAVPGDVSFLAHGPDFLCACGA